MDEQSRTPFMVSLISGAVAGVSVDVSLFPLDTIKTRLQSAEGFWRAGGFRNIYRGLSVTSLGAAPGAALFFCCYDSSKYHIKHRYGTTPDAMIHLYSSCIAEAFACVVRVPTEVVKQRMQTRFSGYSMVQVGRAIVSTDGFAGLYTGFRVTLMREIPFAAIQLPLYEYLKMFVGTHFSRSREGREVGISISPLSAAVCGSIAGGIAAAVTTPLDVAKTRIMIGSDLSGRRYTDIVDTMRRVWSEGGASSLFAGMQPRVAWISIGGFVFFGAYELTKKSIISL